MLVRQQFGTILVEQASTNPLTSPTLSILSRDDKFEIVSSCTAVESLCPVLLLQWCLEMVREPRVPTTLVQPFHVSSVTGVAPTTGSERWVPPSTRVLLDVTQY